MTSPTDPIDKRIAEIRERCDKATESPWEVEDYRDAGDWRSTGKVWGGLGHHICQVNCDKLSSVSPKEQISEFETNAEFISASRTDIPWLVSELSKTREALGLACRVIRCEIEETKSQEALAQIDEILASGNKTEEK
jgi:hypothetical protein